jgi:hypothetical protein
MSPKPGADIVVCVGTPAGFRTASLAQAAKRRGLQFLAVDTAEYFAANEQAFHDLRQAGVTRCQPIYGNADNAGAIYRAVIDGCEALGGRMRLVFGNQEYMLQAVGAAKRALVHAGRLDSKFDPNPNFRDPMKLGQLDALEGTDYWRPHIQIPVTIGTDKKRAVALLVAFMRERAGMSSRGEFEVPLVIKASPGGEGITIRIARNLRELWAALHSFDDIQMYRGVHVTEMHGELGIALPTARSGRGSTSVTIDALVYDDNGVKRVEILSWRQKLTRIKAAERFDVERGETVRVPGMAVFDEVAYICRGPETAPSDLVNLAHVVASTHDYVGLFTVDAQMVGPGTSSYEFVPAEVLNRPGVRAVHVEQARRQPGGSGLNESILGCSGYDTGEAWMAAMLGEPIPKPVAPQVEAVGSRHLYADEFDLLRSPALRERVRNAGAILTVTRASPRPQNVTKTQLAEAIHGSKMTGDLILKGPGGVVEELMNEIHQALTRHNARGREIENTPGEQPSGF